MSRALFFMLAICATTLSACSLWSPLTRCHTALEWPVSLVPGSYESPEFTTQFGTQRYGITLVTPRGAIPFKQHSCYLGMEYPKDCPNDPVQINVKWEVLNGSTIVSKGVQQGLAGNGGFTKKDIDRPFMSMTAPEKKQWSHNAFTPFVAKENEKYKMRLTTPAQLLVRQARARSGLTQAAFAERIGTPVATLRDWEQGRFAPPGGVLCLLRLISARPELARELESA